ncbi:carboxypeptidase regulatory-like domain-containing protein [Amycolatopsis sp. NPDC006125]|uniref:carboxypeptidase regulatory-like domain-containing protein n=1 Tax=Amycolatopsis sp. NPDC006125 TaxID=3156730 RepID=UPI0033BCC285
MAEHVETQEQEPGKLRTLAESLWFPVFFALGFVFCYLLAFHAPSPHHIEVAVADETAAARIEAALGQASPDAFDIQPVATADQARQAVLDRDATAAYSADPARPTLFVAKADGYLLESVLNQAFAPVAAQTGHALTVVDLAPTEPGDAMGTGLFYLVLIWNIPSYIVVMMLLRAVTLSRRAKVATLVGFGALLTLIGYAGGVAMDVIPNDPVAIPVAFLLTQAVSLTSFGLVPLVKQWFPGVAMGLFVLLSMPSSGGAVPVQMVPGFFRALHPFFPMGNLIEALRGIFYFDGRGVLRPVLVLCGWVLLGVVLIAGHALVQRRKGGAVEEPPVEDPAFEMPQPTAVPADRRHFGEPVPTLTGAVHAADGSPVPGAAVTVMDGRGHQLVRTTADDEGRYAVAGLPGQFVDLVVSAPGFEATASRALVREGGTTHRDFTLRGRQPLVSAAR